VLTKCWQKFNYADPDHAQSSFPFHVSCRHMKETEFGA
jgi:hypothetical protein